MFYLRDSAPRDGSKFISFVVLDGVVLDVGITWYWAAIFRDDLCIAPIASFSGGPASTFTHWAKTDLSCV